MTELSGTARLLLDTHVLIWWLQASPELSDDLRNRIDTELDVYVSAASVWELSIKQAAGKIKLPDDLREWIERGGLSELPISMAHADVAGRLPPIHRDPFDRMLVAQALVERLTLVTRDGLIQRYDVPILEA
ncbi:type II toxin-antitoxin system VapC family toxin [Kribbella jiaozuonensis]|uniref:Type II toxin-antitoxin system VapC family toxin n=1 Tax=Kribbella jiaozuonensis TaxID=2575441 RepID=A0A4U3LGB9_9ACTN|nr:type II toxin-antitoxin system VapC family toxin [Kribbella jiaozuonensis]TKK74595.1 type II toxin-antitoxin system VapC family toxin [Kribbella jiaozuonensis]